MSIFSLLDSSVPLRMLLCNAEGKNYCIRSQWTLRSVLITMLEPRCMSSQNEQVLLSGGYLLHSSQLDQGISFGEGNPT